MSYIEKTLLVDERVVYAATLHWILYLRGLGITAFGGLLGYFALPLLAILFGDQLAQEFARPCQIVALGIVAVGCFLLLGAYVRQTSTEFAVTDRRLIAKYGFISRTTYEIMITRITGANFDQTISGRIMGFGTVWVHGAGGEISPFDAIDEPQLFYKALVTVMERAQGR